MSKCNSLSESRCMFSFPGELQLPLNSVDLAGPVEEWKDLAPVDDGSNQYLGDLCLSLRYVPSSGKLTGMHTPSFLSTLQLQTQIMTWKRGFSNLKMLCSWRERANIWCQMPFRCLKFLIWAGREFKVKKDFQPCFTEWKAHGGSGNRSASLGNLDAHPWKFLEI